MLQYVLQEKLNLLSMIISESEFFHINNNNNIWPD